MAARPTTASAAIGRAAENPDLITAVAGLAATAGAIAYVAWLGPTTELVALAGVFVFLGMVAAFVVVPWIAVALLIPYFAVVEVLKTFVDPLIGATKDIVTFAAVVAAAILFVQRRASRQSRSIDGFVIFSAALVIGLYLANLGGSLSGESGYGFAWFHGVRLFAEPVSLLLVGLTLRDPRRCFNGAAKSLVATSVVVALVGLVQHVLGVERLLDLGYTFGEEVRYFGPNVRAFGTLGEPFAYAGFLLFGIATLLLWGRASVLRNVALAVIVAGLYVSYVRTAVVIAAALIGLALARKRFGVLAVLLLLAAVTAGAAIFATASQQATTRSVPINSSTYLTLNNRTPIWKDRIGKSPTAWIFGRGVGAVGTAAERAQQSLSGKQEINAAGNAETVVDSGYLALTADVGLVGLAFFIALLTRLAILSRRATSRGALHGWFALGILTVMLLDASTRESFVGFPTAYIGMLVLGLAVASSQQDESGTRAPVAERAAASG